MEKQTERIDGTDYVVGTPEYGIAKARLEQRLDEDYLEANRDIYERNVDLIREMPRLDERYRSDANASAFLARQLVFVRGQVERTVYERVRAKEFVPVETGHPRGAATYETQRMDQVGKAKITHDLAGDAPRADVSVTADPRKYVNVRASYGYSVQDLEYAAFANVPLQRWKADACAEVIARGLDLIGQSGDALAGLKGFFNSADVPLFTLGGGEWLTTGTVAEILQDLADIEQQIINNSKDNLALAPYRLVLPSAYEGKLMTTRLDGTSDMSIGQYFLKNARVIKSIERYTALDGAVTPAVAASDAPQGICYPADPSVLFWPISITYEEQAPEIRGWEWLVEARARCGGVEWRRGFQALYFQNLD
jgi:hypothetical protein